MRGNGMVHEGSPADRKKIRNGYAKRFILQSIAPITLILLLALHVVQPASIEAATNVSGEITQDTTWTLLGSPYLGTGDITIAHAQAGGPAATLTIEPGVEVRFNRSSRMLVGYGGRKGAISARGTGEQPVVFTSNSAAPAPGDWWGIVFQRDTDSAATLLEHCIVEYGGGPYAHFANLYIEHASPTIRKSIIRYSNNMGISLNGSSNPVLGGEEGAGNIITNNGTYGVLCTSTTPNPVITHNTIANNGSYPIRLRAMMNNIHDNTYTGNGIQAFDVMMEDITADVTWRNSGLPYVVAAGDMTIANAAAGGPTATLTIEPGVEIRFSPTGRILVGSGGRKGAISARGTGGQPIVFTSSKSAPAPGDWWGIVFYRDTDSAGTLLEHCIVEYGGGPYSHFANLYIDQASPTIRYCKIRYSNRNGVHIIGSGSDNAPLTCNTFEGNNYGLYAVDAKPSVHDNNFLGNLTAGLINAGSGSFDATNNWWGDAAGPNRTGDAVAGAVTFTPWLTAPSACADSGNSAPFLPAGPTPAAGAESVPLTGSLGTSVDLRWTGGDPDPGDLVAYDVFFGPSLSSLVKIANGLAAAAYTASGLSPATSYFWQIIARDRQGAETAGPVWSFTTWGPDLLAHTVAIDPASGVVAGQSVTITATILNGGTGPVANAFPVDFRIDGQSAGTRLVPAGLQAGVSAQVSLVWTALTGNHLLEVIADSDAVVFELNETNNLLSRVIESIPDTTPPEMGGANLPDGGYVQRAEQIVVTLADRYGGTLDEAFIIGSFAVRDINGLAVAGTVTRLGDQFIFIPASPLADGTYLISLVARDMAGNTREYGFSFTLDSRPPAKPVITGGSVASGPVRIRPAVNWSNVHSVTLTGTREPNTAVWLRQEWMPSRIHHVGSGQQYATIQSAIDAAVDGDLIVIEPGIYSEKVTMTRWVHLKGNAENPDQVVIRYPVDGSGSLVCAMTGANPVGGPIIIEGIRIESSNSSGYGAVMLRNLTGLGEVIFNRCKLIAASYWNWPAGSFGYEIPTDATVEFRNCYIERGYGHFYQMGSSRWRLHRSVLNDAFTCLWCTHPPNPNDTVTAPADGYGPDYGAWRLTTVFDEVISPLGSGDWSAAPLLNPGSNTFEIWLVDAAGNRGPSEWVEIRVDAAAPLVLSVTPADGGFTGNASAPVEIEFREEGSGLNLEHSLRSLKQGQLDVAGDWSLEGNRLRFTPAGAFIDAEYTIELCLEDHAGNRSPTLQYHFTVDTASPPTPMIDPVASPTPNRNQLIRGIKEAYAGILMNGAEIVGHTPDTLWQYTATLAPGQNQLAFIAEDRAGNRSASLGTTIFYDDIAPQRVDTLAVSGERTGTTALLTWSGYNESLHGDVTSYRVYAEPSAFTSLSGLTPKAIVAAGAFSHTLGGLTKGATYWFAVAAVDTAGNFRPEATPIAAVILDRTAPENATNLQVLCYATRLVFSWAHSADSAGDLAGYRVYFNGTMEEIQRPTNVTGYEGTDLSAATAYPFRVTSYDRDGNESAGASMDAITLLANPTGLTILPWSGYVDLAWSPVIPAPYIKHYLVYASEHPFTTVTGMTPRVSATSPAAKVAGLTNNTTYHFAVTAVNLSNGEQKEVTAVVATPLPDTQGPGVTNLKMGGTSFIGGATLRNSGLFALDVSDPSGISRIEFFLDGTLVKTSIGGLSHHEWWLDLTGLPDGSHLLSVKSYDTLGNMTTNSYDVVVSLDPPPAPIISQPQSGLVINRPSLRVSGTAERNTEVALFVNGIQRGGYAAVDGSGSFTTELMLASGENRIRAAARNRAGAGPQSAELLVMLDTNIPAAPMGLAAQGRAGGMIRLTWQASPEGTAKGYHIHRSATPFSATGEAQRLTADPISMTSYEDIPATDGVYYYRATVVTQAGNESALSAQVSAVSDRVLPRATAIEYTPAGLHNPATGRMSAGIVNVRLTLNKPLQTLPFLSITPEGGVPINVQVTKNSDLEYAGSFVIAGATPSGTAYAVFSARDIVGNRGTDIDAGGTIRIDTMGPMVSRLSISLQDPIRTGSQNPVTVTVTAGLTEGVKNGTSPEMTWLLSGPGRTPTPVPLSRIATNADDVETWQGAFTLPTNAGQTAPESIRFFFHAVDDLDNSGVKISGRSVFQVYQGDLPPLGVPVNVKAKALAGGKIRLSWDEVAEAAGYRIYRRAPGESSLNEHQSVPAGAAYTDATSVDGAYVYAVASLRDANGQQAVSGMSDTVPAEADSVAPDAPQNFALTLSGQGIAAQWQAPSSTGTITYSLYRSPLSAITSVAGLTPIMTGIRQPQAVDPTPSAAEHCYVVTALDEAGNESAPSNSVYLNFNLLPVATLTVKQQDAQAPAVSWTDAGGNATGFDIFVGREVSRVKLNEAPLTATTYTDSGYTGDERCYGVVALDASGQGSPERSLTLPSLKIAMKEGARISRGVMNRLEYTIENRGAATLEQAHLRVSLGGRIHASAFSLEAGEKRMVPVIVGGYGDLPGEAPVSSTVEWIPNAGEKVEIVRTAALPVDDGMLGLELLNDQFTRGGSGRVRFTLRNTGDEAIEIVTARNAWQSPSDEVLLLLLDGDGNVLSTAGFHQSTGDQLVTLVSGNTVARIPAGGSFSSHEASIPIPLNAPGFIKLKLAIANVYHRQGTPEEVKMDGVATTQSISLIDTPYRGDVTTIVPENSTGDQEIVITGRAVERATGRALPLTELKLVLTRNGFERNQTVFTGADGTFRYAFRPLAAESGIFTVRAVHPSVTDRPIQGRFTVAKVSVTPATVSLNIPKNYDQALVLKATAGESTQATNLRVVFNASDQPGGAFPQGVHVTPAAPISLLDPGTAADTGFRIWADNTAEGTATLVLKVVSDEAPAGAWGTVTVNVRFSAAVPTLYVAPAYLETGVSLGGAVSETVNLENRGLAEMTDVALSLVNTDGSAAPNWAVINAPPSQGTLQVGEKRAVSLSFAPGASIAEGNYAFHFRVASSNHETRNIGLYVAVTQSGQGNALFKVTDLYTGTMDRNNQPIQGLSGATIRLQNEQVLTIERTGTTDNLGEALFENLPVGRYRCRVTAGNHQEYTGRLWVKPGITVNSDVFLSYDLVTVEWSVTETTIADRYELVLKATYETNVPAAVVIAEPSSISLPKMRAGDTYHGEIALTNHGLLRADNVQFSLPANNQYFRYELMGGLPSSINAKERVTVAYRVTCMKSPDQQEEQGSGGGCGLYSGCLNVGYDCTCANGNVQKGSSLICFSYSYGECIDQNLSGPEVSGGAGPAVASPAPSSKAMKSGSGSGSGGACAPTPPRKGPGGGCAGGEQGAGRCPKDAETDQCQPVGSYVDILHKEYHRDDTDLSVRVPGGMIELRRAYYNNRWYWSPGGDALTFEKNSLNNRISAVERGGVTYKVSAPGADIYAAGAYRIVKKEGIEAWRWDDNRGSWKEYDGGGRMTSYGNKTDVIGKLIYEPGEGGKLLSITDRNDRIVFTFEYNQERRVSAVRDPDGRRVEFAYANGNLSRIKDALNYETAYEYDAAGLMTKVIDAENRQTDIAYDGNGYVVSVTDGGGNRQTFEYEYDAGKKIYFTRITSAAGTIKEVWHDRDGDTIGVDLNGRAIKRIAKLDAVALREMGYGNSAGGNMVICEPPINYPWRYLFGMTDAQGNSTDKAYDSNDTLLYVKYPGEMVRYEYGAPFNQVTKITNTTNEDDVITLYDYDGKGNLTKKIEASGTADERITTYTYDGANNLVTTTVAGDAGAQPAMTTMTYDAYGNVQTMADAEGNVTTFTYDGRGNVLTKTDGAGKTWTYGYDAKGRLTSTTDPRGHAMQLVYDGVGNKVREIDPQAKVRVFEYNQKNKVTAITDSQNNVTRFEYDADGHLTKQIDPEGGVVSYVYDQDGRLVKTVDGGGNEITNVYTYAQAGSGCTSCSGGQNKPTKTIFPTFARQYAYDQRGRKTAEMDIIGTAETNVTQYAYDGRGNLKTKTDREGKITTYAYDALNRLTRATDPLNLTTVYAYDKRDNLIALTDAKNQTTTFGYDRNNYIIREARPQGQMTTYQYDAAGRLSRKTDAKGQRIDYSYDGGGRLTEISHFDASGTPAKTIALNYDASGNLTAYADGTASGAYTYDDLDRKTAETVNYGAFSATIRYGYGANSLKKSFSYPDGTMIDYRYDANNRFVGMQIPNIGFIAVDGHQWYRPTGMTLPGGGKTQVTHDPLMRTKSIIASDPGQNAIQRYQYSYDKMDNIRQKNTEHGDYSYTYDELYRLTQAENANLNNEAYTYDEVGNRLTSNAASNWTYNANNELVSHDGTTYQYDANGNMIQKTQNGQTTNYLYDADNRLIRIAAGSGAVITEYTYDPFGRRIKKDTGGTVTYFVYSDEGLIGEYDNTGNEIKRYGYKPDSLWSSDPLFMKQGNDYFFYHNDHLGTPQKLAAMSGAVEWSATYDAFGKATVDPASTITNNLRFPGQYYDQETGLHYNFHRYYNPEIGIFITADPIGFEGDDINLNRYVWNNPLKWFDQYGLAGDGQNAWQRKSEELSLNYYGYGEYIIALVPEPRPAWGHSDMFGNKQFNWTREDYGWSSPIIPLIGTPRHFRDAYDSIRDVWIAIEKSDKVAFERAMHQLQDYPFHRKKGYGSILGHAWDTFILGLDPDNDLEGWYWSNKMTIRFVNEWNRRWCE